MKSTVYDSSKVVFRIPMLDQIRVLGFASHFKLDRASVTTAFRTNYDVYTIPLFAQVVWMYDSKKGYLNLVHI